METDRRKDLSEKLLDGEQTGHEGDYSHEGEEEAGWKKRYCNISNTTVLIIVCCLFACFATTEIVAAVSANSLALLGDGTASVADVITYCTNLYAESIATPKAPPTFIIEDGPNDEQDTKVIGRDSTILRDPSKDERTRLIHEVYVPTFSVFTLIIVTIGIMSLAVAEIRSGGDDETDYNLMFIIASVNVVVDVTCIALFYGRKEDILHNKFTSFSGDPVLTKPEPKQRTMFSNANINMFSAFTHVGSDTLRTLAIYLAAIAAATSTTKTSLCDAWAAIAVSITIYFAMIPLLMEVYAAYMGTR